MKKLWFGLLATLLLTIFVVPAFAWEFNMSGQFEWRYRYLGRANGYQDLFGDMRFQDSPLNTTGELIGFAGPNFWRGYNGNNANPMATNSWGSSIRVVKGGFSFADSDASEYDQRMTFVPTIRVNNAIRFDMNMDLASIRQKYNHRDFQTNGPLDRWYQDRVSQNAFDTAMIPSINQFKLVFQTPWCIFSLGAKDFPFGTGSLLGYNTRASALLALIPYGPFTFVPGIWVDRNPDGWTAFLPYGLSTGPGPNSLGPVTMDKGLKNTILWAMLGYYRNGPVDIGGGFIHEMRHNSQADRNGETALDLGLMVYEIYGKYNNGRFFANAEYNWANLDETFASPNPLTWVYPAGHPLYYELSSFYGEAGAICGPAKLAFLFAWSGGPALNLQTNGFGQLTKVYGGLTVNNQNTDAYNYLMFHTYGGGNNAPWASTLNLTCDENGMMFDAYALAARLDYALAANLNIWGSYMWASRVEQNGTYAGQYNGFAGAFNGSTPNSNVTAAQNWKIANMPGAGANVNPYVDDTYLGWEAQLGVDWKLLENMTVCSRYAYWQPGPWFDEAYQVVGVNPRSGAPSTGTYMQGRSAIQAFSSSIMVDF